MAYVFVHVLPELPERQQAFDETTGAFSEQHGYLLALVGFAAFYGLERLANRSKELRAGGEVAGVETETSAGVFWSHVDPFTNTSIRLLT